AGRARTRTHSLPCTGMKLKLQSLTVALDDVGTGTAVVFLHGFPHSRALWHNQLAALSGVARCIAPDLRGFGQSDAAGPWTMDRYADDVLELLNALQIQRAIIVGLSMGGYIAMACWRRFPDRVRALVFMDTHM